MKVSVGVEKRDEWEIRDDVRTLKQAMNIQSDPNRLKDAQDYIIKERQQENSILGIKSSGKMRKSNSATLGSLKIDY